MSETTSSREGGLHQPFVKQKLQHRLRHFTAANIKQLGRARIPGGLAEDAMPDWFAALTAVQRQIVRDSQQRSRTSSRTLAKTLKGLKSVAEFAQPLLEGALHKRFGIKVDTLNTWLYHVPFSDVLLTDQNLLQLALRNFEDDQVFAPTQLIAEQGEAAPQGEGSEGLYGWYYPSFGPSKCYRIKKLAIQPADFARLCRELNIGKQYQEHLATIFDGESASDVKSQTIEASKDSLRTHAHVARLTSLLTPTGYLAVLGVLNGEQSPKLDGEAVTFSQLHVLGVPVSEMFVIGGSRRKRKKVDLSWSNPGTNLLDVATYTDSRIIVCMPGDPVAAIKEYASLAAFEQDLALRLRDVAYQRSFLRLIPHGDAGRFLGTLQNALETREWDSHAAHREQTLTGHIDGIYRRVYREEPTLNLAEGFFDGDLFDELYTRHETRLKESAAQLAVPTATVDHDAWKARLEHYAEWGLNILNVAAFFIPGLGEVMMAVMAVQLTLDVYHGAEAWSVGDTDQAWGYLGSVAANLTFVAVLGAAAGKAPKILSAPIVDGMVRIKLPFGDEQLWRPSLAPYKSNVVLPAGLKPNSLGQYEVAGSTYIRLEDNVYEKTFDQALGKWRLKHPNDPQAYQPVLQSNEQGAWRHTFERPLSWDRQTLLRRLGHVTDELDSATLEHIARISGVDDNALRKIHVDQQPVPSVLSDTLRQFRYDRWLNEVNARAGRGEPVAASDFLDAVGGTHVSGPQAAGFEPLHKTFPTLSTDALNEVLNSATVRERLSIQQTAKLPPSLLLKARTRARLARLNTALAGMHLQSLASLDSQRLALRALEKLPGWPQRLRLELRQHHYTGKVLASVGSESAEEIKYLVTDGHQHHQTHQFQAFDQHGNPLNSVSREGDNFYASIMHALPDDARVQLGLPNVGQSPALQEALCTYARTHRESMFETLLPTVAGRRFKAPQRLADGRVGYPLSGRGTGAMVNPSLICRVQDLYPEFSDEMAERMVSNLLLDGSTETQIAHLLSLRALEYETLATQLEQWSRRGGEPAARRQVVQMLNEAWRSGGLVDVSEGVHLDLGNAGVLPELTARFRNVSSLRLSVQSLLSQSSEAFVRQFPNVHTLELYVWDTLERTQLVEKLSELTGVRGLLLGGNLGQEFSATAQMLVNVMPQLETMTLRGISTQLDVSRLPNLRTLNLAGNLQAWPEGALQLPNLEKINFSSTELATLPAELFSGHENLWRGLDLNWARLEPEQFVKAYEYVRDNPAHLLDVDTMLDRYSQGALQVAINCDSELAVTALRQLKAEGLSGRALLDHVNGVRHDQQALSRQMMVWQEHSATVNGRPVDARGRETAARLIRECWRSGLLRRYGKTGELPISADLAPGSSISQPLPVIELDSAATLDLSGTALGNLPDLSVLQSSGFAHVQTLKMADVMAPVDNLGQFLQHFSELRSLDLRSNQLFDLPSTLGGLTKLKELSLPRNYLTITVGAQERLNRLTALEFLDLRYNRIETLDISSLRALKRLRLGYTAISGWPRGALDVPALVQLELNNSAVATIPQAIFNGHGHLWVDMSGCLLTAEARYDLLANSPSVAPMGISRADLRDGINIGGPAYFPPLASLHPELLLPLRTETAEQLARFTPKARLQRLDPDLLDVEALRAVDDLTLSTGGAGALFAQIDEWDKQFQALTETLNEWITQPPFQLRELSVPLWVSVMERRKAADQILSCWRHNLRGGTAVADGSASHTLDMSENPLGSLPTLTGDFSHVGTLKLNKVFIYETGADGFMRSFEGIHTLELDGNFLTALPEPVTTLTHLTRLSASSNQLSWTPQLQRQIAALGQLQSLDLSHNWLEVLDVSSLTQLHTLDVCSNRLVDWPAGVLRLPALTSLNLRDNMLESIPQALLTEPYRELRLGTNVTSNDNLDGAALLMLRNEVTEGESIMGWSTEELDEVLDGFDTDSAFDGDTSDISDEDVDIEHVTGPEARQRWIDEAASDADEMTRIWSNLEQAPNNAAFFNLLDRMEGTKDFKLGRADLTRRVHRVLTAAASDAELCDTVFVMAQSAQTCGDGRILLFSDIEVKVFEFDTVKSTPANQQDSVLFKLGRKLFRLGRIEKIANRDVQQRQAQGGRPDPAEVRLAYRIGLGDRLELPGQPKDMLYSGNVSAASLDAAYAEVIGAEQSAEFKEDLVTRKYWTDQLKRKYAARLAALKDKQAQIQSELEDRHTAITEAYLAEVVALEVTFKTQETALLLELTEVERQQFSQ